MKKVCYNMKITDFERDKLMEKQFYQLITEGVFDALKAKGYKRENYEEGEYFADGKKAFKISYNEEKEMISLNSADLKEGESVEFKELSSWLLQTAATESDMTSIKNDFVDTVLENLGEKASVAGIKKVEMPTKKKNADTIDIESFTARFLAIFPEYKNEYKENIVKYGEFLYDDFYKNYGVLCIAKVFDEGNKRHISKYFELLNLAYTNGEQTVATTVVYSIICERLNSEKSYEKEMETQLQKFPHLNRAVTTVQNILKTKKSKYM